MSQAAAKAAGCGESKVFLASTGVIGEPLDTNKFSHLLAGLVTGGKMSISGNRGAAAAMFDALDQPDFWFNTVTP